MNSIAVVSMDIHKRFSKAVAMSAEGEIVEEGRIAHGDHRLMQAYFSRFAPGTPVVMEATFNWPWVADLAEDSGLDPHLAHPPRLREYAKGLAKTDRKDAIFQGKLWLAKEVFPESYRAPAAVRQMRALFRLRLLWVRMRTMMKNNVHGQLLKLGLVLSQEATDLFSLKGRQVLAGLELKDEDRAELERKLSVIDSLSEHIQELDGEINAVLKQDEHAAILMSLPGIGQQIAYAILAEVGEFSRFPNGRALASYAGLLPVPRQSGGRERERRTTSGCNRFLKWAFLEAVSGATRSSRHFKSLHARVRARNRQRPGKARVAVARELAELAHLLVTRDVRYEERPMMPKHKQRTQSQTR
ncbi:MAG: IS110 family transposase [Anaerolineae bacterium]|nr:IS110 family transposase [Anaerolineae bacterium]